MSKYKQPTEKSVDEAKLNKPSFLNNIVGSIETISAVPTGKPTKLIDQIKFYSSGATYRLYVYNANDDVWRYTTLT